jgi:hypothetical protein
MKLKVPMVAIVIITAAMFSGTLTMTLQSAEAQAGGAGGGPPICQGGHERCFQLGTPDSPGITVTTGQTFVLTHPGSVVRSVQSGQHSIEAGVGVGVLGCNSPFLIVDGHKSCSPR